MNVRYVAFAVVLALLAVGLAVQYRAEARGASKKGMDFTLPDTNGKQLKLSTYRGKVVVVDVWATWCHFCVEEIPDLIALQEKATKDKTNVQFIGVALDDPDAVKTFVKDHKLNYPVVIGDKKAMKPFGEIPGFPTKFILDKNGVVVEKIVGARDKDELEKTIAKYVKAK